MKLVITLSSLLLFVITATTTLSKNELTHNEPTTPIAINDIVIYEVEEEADICFDTEKYLPENFNALKGKYDIDWSKIDLVDEPKEELVFDFNTEDYLPEGFDAHKKVATVKSSCKYAGL